MKKILFYRTNFMGDNDIEYICTATIYLMKLQTMPEQYRLKLECQSKGESMYQHSEPFTNVGDAERMAHNFVIEYDPDYDPAAEFMSD